ncbi:putative eSX-1 secretion-associated protein EspJ [Mycobacterium kansasii]|uniref:Putative eSX-1 secretion-associated protein EspJ n=1 Tax=Mycobacterium kansasii TaxID=1768 RepID=A0A1V3X884_MYCKA|nr:putative eSX-1 secretion-associated protein EspJ [Mycobacterium kansasii]
MAEPLAVDPARLIAAGSKLADLVFPTLPAPIAATGSDPVSAAINETMPGIESLVSDGLPGVSAALKRTATSMATAADIYSKADQSLGDALTQYQFGSDGQQREASGVAGAAASLTGQSAQSLGAPAAQLLGAPAAQLLSAPAGAVSQLGQAVSAQAEALSPRVAATVPQVVQLAHKPARWRSKHLRSHRPSVSQRNKRPHRARKAHRPLSSPPTPSRSSRVSSSMTPRKTRTKTTRTVPQPAQPRWSALLCTPQRAATRRRARSRHPSSSSRLRTAFAEVYPSAQRDVHSELFGLT